MKYLAKIPNDRGTTNWVIKRFRRRKYLIF